MFLETQETPNPNTIKIVPHRVVRGEESPLSFDNEHEARNSPFSMLLFSIDGIKNVYLGSDFISITKEDGIEWPHIRAFILHGIADAFARNIPIFYDPNETQISNATDTNKEGASLEQSLHGKTEEQKRVIQDIVRTLETYVQPAVANDGGEIRFVRFDFEHGIAKLEMHGACKGCPSSATTLRKMVETTLRYYVPEVEGVEEVS